MKKWSHKLIELSREYLNYNGMRVKSLSGQFGELSIDYVNQTFTIIISNSEQTLTFKSVDEMINSGWAVD